jgi:hypothetical protein
MKIESLLRTIVSDLNAEIETFRNAKYIKDKKKHAIGCLILLPLLNYYNNEDGSLLYLDIKKDAWIVKDSFIPDIDNDGLSLVHDFLKEQS